MPQFEMSLSLGGVILIVGQLCTVFIVVWNRSRTETEQRGRIDTNTAKLAALEVQTDARAAQIEAKTSAALEQLDTEFNAKLSATQAQINLTRDQHHELREHLAVNYMKREEIKDMERRINDGQTALRADLSKLDGKIDAVQKTVLEAIANSQRATLDAISGRGPR